jgi:hypothetical protein
VRSAHLFEALTIAVTNDDLVIQGERLFGSSPGSLVRSSSSHMKGQKAAIDRMTHR